MTANTPPEAIAPAPPAWSLLRRLGFRFFCVYFVLYCLPFPLDHLVGVWPAGLGPVVGGYEQGSNLAVAWFGEHVLRLDPATLAPFRTGSGDTTRSYVGLALYATLALAATIAWSFTFGRPAHPRFAALLRTYLRYVLAVTMLGYGTAKFGSGQFPPLSEHPDWMLTTWGDSSPMGVVWKFMGASPAYTAFSGFVECLGGVLLLWRRTATLGALVTAGAMLNVAMLNFCYDVPVKQYSTHLLVFAVWIAGRDCGVLWDALIRHRPTRPAALRAPRALWLLVLEQLLKYALVGWLLYHSGFGLYRRLSASPDAPPLAKLYEVTKFTRDGNELPPLLTDATRWRYLAPTPTGLSVRMTDGKTRSFAQAEIDAAAKTITRKLPAPAKPATNEKPATAEPTPTPQVLTW
ncbi:MAG: hypothetical protein RL398_1068, partial [Planctomycetota bacterium]